MCGLKIDQAKKGRRDIGGISAEDRQMVDLEWQLKIPRSDLVLVSEHIKQALLLELTVLW